MSAREIARKLRARLAQKNWTQERLAVATGIGQPQISRICAGNFKRITHNVAKVCEYANVTLRKPAKAGRLSAELSDAIRELLAGSKQRERALLRLIEAGIEVFDSRRSTSR